MPRGRPRIPIDPEKTKKILAAIRAGNYMETAAAYAGISKNLLYDWIRRGEEEFERVRNSVGARKRVKVGEEQYFIFYQGLQEAMASAEVRDVMMITKAANGGGVLEEVEEVYDGKGNLLKKTVTKRPIEPKWVASAWRLERKFPNRWGRKLQMADSDEVDDIAKDVIETIAAMKRATGLRKKEDPEPEKAEPETKASEDKPRET